jgi:uroporphyrinogen decarboxylase
VDLVQRVTALQADTAYFYNIFSPSTLLKFNIGLERYLALFSENPDALAGVLRVIAQSLSVLSGLVISRGGADGIYLSVQNPDLSRIKDDAYRQFITPSDLLVLDAANAFSAMKAASDLSAASDISAVNAADAASILNISPGGNNILHICGYEGARNHPDAWVSYNARAYNWAVQVEGLDLGEGKKLFGGKAVIGGFANPSGSLIHTGPRKAIEDFTEKLLREAGKTGVILGADCTVPRDINLEHLRWVRAKAASL